MQVPEIDAILLATLDDHRLSRSERRALRAVVADACLTPGDRALWRSRAFALAQAAASDADARTLLPWLDEVTKALVYEPEAESSADVSFSPGPAPLARLTGLIERAAASIDVCVFALSDDRLAAALLQAQQRSVRVRVLTDDDKTSDRGADADRLQAQGIPLRTDRTEHHMHHKFAIFDATTVATGSYNWTRSASLYNTENVLVTTDPRVVRAYQGEFERLWDDFA
ncbi:MAG: phospholipase D-like domain-containing protein [Myxococcota bacterium]